MNNNLGFIPARGGSKRLPRKNIKELGGLTLVQRAVDAAVHSGQFSQIVLSTDNEDVVNSITRPDELVVDNRPKALAEDKATVLQTVLELMERWENTGAASGYDTITILLPTCPFRNAKHIIEGFELLDKDTDSVVSVAEYEFPWEMALDLDEQNNMKPAIEPSPLVTGNTRSQDRRRVYHPNGAFYIGRWSVVKRDRNFFKGRLRGYPMNRFHSADIDEPIDFKIAELFISEDLI